LRIGDLDEREKRFSVIGVLNLEELGIPVAEVITRIWKVLYL
jgi:hypothetical protein